MAEGDGLENRLAGQLSDGDSSTCERADGELGALLGVLERECPELVAIIVAWAGLPPHVRQTIVTLVESVRENNSATE